MVTIGEPLDLSHLHPSAQRLAMLLALSGSGICERIGGSATPAPPRP